MKPTLLDRAIGVFSPRTAAERMRWRATMSAMQQYDAAGRSNRTHGWRAPGGDANVAATAGRRVRLVARDMVRNNAIARRAVATLVDNIVGDGIIPNIEASSDRLQRRLTELTLAHLDTTSIDAAGRTNLYGLQRLAVQSAIVDGDAIWRRRPRRISDPASLPFQIEALEVEHLDDRPRALGGASGQGIEDGIEFDAIGRRVAYHLYRWHPDGARYGAPEAVRVTAENIMHLYRLERPGQHRGISWLAPVIALMSDAYDYADAQLVRQKIAAMWVAFTKDTLADGPEVASAKDMPEVLTPGMFEHLPAGRDLVFSNPPAAEGYEPHMRSVQRMIAAGLGITYEEQSGDLSGVNFSSARIGRLAMQRAISAVQWTVVMPVMCDPLERWLREAIAEREPTLRGEWRVRWTPPRFPMTDPAREVPAMVAEIAGGLSSRPRKIRELGFDPEEIDREIEEDLETQRRLGVKFGPPAASGPAPAATSSGAAEPGDDDPDAKPADEKP